MQGASFGPVGVRGLSPETMPCSRGVSRNQFKWLWRKGPGLISPGGLQGQRWANVIGRRNAVPVEIQGPDVDMQVPDEFGLGGAYLRRCSMPSIHSARPMSSKTLASSRK